MRGREERQAQMLVARKRPSVSLNMGLPIFHLRITPCPTVCFDLAPRSPRAM